MSNNNDISFKTINNVTFKSTDNIWFRTIDNINDLKKYRNFRFIKISNNVKEEIKKGDIHEGVIGIVFGSNMNYKIDKNNLPSTLKYLILGFNFNQDLDNLPSGLEELSVGYNFKSKIKNIPNLKKLTIKSDYNLQLPYLPNTKIYMYSKNIGTNVFKNYNITIKKCEDKKNYVVNDDLFVIKMKGYKNSYMWFTSLLCKMCIN